jgi:hypothetical protein
MGVARRNAGRGPTPDRGGSEPFPINEDKTMSKNKSNTRANEAPAIAPAETPAETAAKVVNVVSESVITGYAGAMLEATSAEREAITSATASAWKAVRGIFRTVLETHGPEAAGIVLSRYKDRAKLENEGKDAGRATNYATTLGKALRALKAGKTLPAELWDASRDEWNAGKGKDGKPDGRFYALFADTAAKSGRKPGGKPAKPEAGEAEGEEAGSVGEEAVKAIRGAAGSKLDALLSEVVSQLRGDFLNEWLDQSRELGQAILARQAMAATGTR